MDAEQSFISMYGQMSRRHRTIFKKELSIIRKAVSGSVTDSAALALVREIAWEKTPSIANYVNKIAKACKIVSALPSGKQQTHGAK